MRPRADAAGSLPASETKVEVKGKKRAEHDTSDRDQKLDYRLAGIGVLHHVECQNHHDYGR